MKKKITLLLYILFVAAFLLEGVVHFAYDRITMPQEEEIDFSNFEIVNMKQTGEKTFVSVTNDPYFEMIDGDRYVMHTVKYILHGETSGARSLYYTTTKEPIYSGKNMIIAKDSGNYTFEFILPMEEIRRIRLDMSGAFNEVIDIDKIIINYRPEFTDYFSVDEMDVAKFIFMPPAIASVLFFVYDLFRYYIRKEKEEI
ncbi:MAG: hypothetical protein E7484_04605 [Ruminococcaceae bacterium]|nr:hypothetical protein [Oscillospiraceae bacterium]